MKKRNLTSLSLNKSVISKFEKTPTVIAGRRPELGMSLLDNPVPPTCGCTLDLPGYCAPPPTSPVTCATTCSPESCYAC